MTHKAGASLIISFILKLCYFLTSTKCKLVASHRRHSQAMTNCSRDPTMNKAASFLLTDRGRRAMEV